MATEQQIQGKIIKLLEQDYDCYVVKVQVASKSGVPDLLVNYKGRFIGIEVKTPVTKHNVSPLQKWNLDRIESKGGATLVAWDINMVKEFMDGY